MSAKLTVEAVPGRASVAERLQTVITVTNSGTAGTTCSKLKFSIPAGEGAADLVSGGAASIDAAPAPGTNWSIAPGQASSAVTFYAMPGDRGGYLAPGAQAGFRFSIPLNSSAGTAPVTVTAYCPSPQATHVPITKSAVAAPDAGTTPQVTSFTADPDPSVAAGKPVKLYWTTTNATSAIIKSPSSAPYSIAASSVAAGSKTVYPQKGVTYTLVAYNGLQSNYGQKTVSITPVSLSSSVPATIRRAASGGALIRWQMSGASQVKVNGVSVSPTAYGNEYGVAANPTALSAKYTVTAYGYLPNGGAYPSFTCNVVTPYPPYLAVTGYTNNSKYYVRTRVTGALTLVLYPNLADYSRKVTNPGSNPYGFAYAKYGKGAAIYVKAYTEYDGSYAGAVLFLARGTPQSQRAYAQNLYFYPSASMIPYGQSVLFKWQVPLATAVTLYSAAYPSGSELTGTPTSYTSYGPPGLSFRGYKWFRPTATFTYSLKVETSGGAQTLLQKVIVIPSTTQNP